MDRGQIETLTDKARNISGEKLSIYYHDAILVIRPKGLSASKSTTRIQEHQHPGELPLQNKYFSSPIFLFVGWGGGGAEIVKQFSRHLKQFRSNLFIFKFDQHFFGGLNIGLFLAISWNLKHYFFCNFPRNFLEMFILNWYTIFITQKKRI